MSIPQTFSRIFVDGFQTLPEGLRWRLGKKLVTILRCSAESDSSLIVRCRDGFRIKVQLEDWLGSHVAVWREYESGLSEIIRRRLKKGDHFLDVGANIGYFSLLAASCVGSEGRVTAIEASPANYDLFLNNIKLNCLSEIIDSHQYAVWNEPCELTLFQGPSSHSGISSVRKLEKTGTDYKVEAIRIDDLLKDTAHKPVSFIKIDVEGAEYQALCGMRNTINTYRPIIALELSDSYLKQLGSSAKELLLLLVKEFGYSPFIYDSKGVENRIEFEELLSNAEQNQLNILFLSNER